ncbi:MAG TPA: hypothetical protein VNL35_16750 [Chloroflexota bacterium]|nr:hypothetical protein [Chloroflexota bacterium]
MLPIGKAPDESTDAAPLTLLILPAPADAEVVDPATAPVEADDLGPTLQEEEEYYKDRCALIEKVQNALLSKTGIVATTATTGALFGSFFLTNSAHAYLAKSVSHTPRFTIPAGTLFVLTYTAPVLLFAAFVVWGVAHLPGGGEVESPGLIPMRDWFARSEKASARYWTARAQAAARSDTEKWDLVRRRIFAAERNLARKVWLSRAGGVILCALFVELGISVLAIVYILTLAIGQPAPQ